MMSGRFVAAMMYTSLRPSIPSISVRSWLTTLEQAGHAKHEFHNWAETTGLPMKLSWRAQPITVQFRVLEE